MKRCVIQLIGCAVLLTVGIAALAQSNESAEQTLTGTVTCAWRLNGWYRCQRGQTPMTCTLGCVEQGSNYELVVDENHHYALAGDASQLAQFAGGPASVTGTLAPTGDSLQVESVSRAEKYSASEQEISPASQR